MNEENEEKELDEKAVDTAKRQVEMATRRATQKTMKVASKNVKKAAAAVAKKALPAILIAVKFIIIFIIILVLISGVFGVIGEVINKIKNFFTGTNEDGTQNSVNSFYSIDDNGIQIKDEEIDRMIQELEDQGITLAEVGLAIKEEKKNTGNTEEEKIAYTKKEKEELRKYLKVFIQADAVTSNIRRKETGLQGIIKVYRTNGESSSEDAVGSKLNYSSYDDFIKMVGEDDSGAENYYSIDPNSGNVLVATWRKTESDKSENDSKSYSLHSSTNLAQAAKQYRFPTMFFIDLCMVTQNPNFVYALANQIITAGETGNGMEIRLTFQDYVTIDESTYEDDEGTEHTTTSYENSVTPLVTYEDTLLYTRKSTYKNEITKTTDDSGDMHQKNEYTLVGEAKVAAKDKEFKKLLKAEYKVAYKVFKWDSPYDDLYSGGDMLIQFMEENVENENLSNMMKYMMYLIYNEDRWKVDIDAIFVDSNDFGFNGSVGIGYSSISITNEDLEILYKITSAERGNGTQEQQQYVVSVILNRVLCKGTSIREVVFAPNQFEPIRNGAYDAANPSATTKAAVDYVVQNGDTTGGATYFCTPKASETNSWYKSSIEKGTLKFLFNDAGGAASSHNFYSNEDDLKKLSQYSQTVGGSGTILNKAAELFKIVSTSGKYTSYGGTSVPCKGPAIDCSSFVSWVLYESGYQEFGGWQKSTSYFYNTNFSKIYNGWTEIPVGENENPISKLQPGDIFVRYETNGTHHMQIVAYISGNRLYAYDCGSLNSWKNNTSGGAVDKTYFLTTQAPGKIIRISSPSSSAENIVAIDAGHGERAASDYYTSGTSGSYNGVNYNEWELNRKVADRAAEILSKNSKIKVERIGNSAQNPKMPNSDRIPKGKAVGADVYVSVHFNSNVNTSSKGTEVYAITGDEKSKALGKVMVDSISSSMGTSNRGVFDNRNDWTIINHSNTTGFPSVILEGAFMSNQSDMKLLATENGVEKYAQGIANGILKYLKL